MTNIIYKNKKLKLPYDLKDGELSTELVQDKIHSVVNQ